MTMRRLVARLINAIFPGRGDDDLAREVASHLALLEDEFRRRGLGEMEARAAARRSFGSTALTMDWHRDARSFAWIADFRRDVRYAFRTLRRTPAFTAVAVLTLALGIGATSAIFTLINDVLLRPLPIRDPQSLVVFGDTRGAGTSIGRQGGSFTLFSYDLYRRLRDEGAFESVCAVASARRRVSVRTSGAAWSEPTYARLVSANYFDVLGTRPMLGRLLRPSDDDPSAPPAAVVSFRYWRDRLDRNPSIVGSALIVDRMPLTVVGVAAPEFYGETLESDPPSVWIPIGVEPRLDPLRRLIEAPDVHWLYLFGRLAPGITTKAAEGRATATLHTWLQTRDGDDSSETDTPIANTHIELRSGASGVTHARRNYGSALRLLLAISAVVLLIACANIANLLLARGAARETEVAIRLAIGASRGRLIRQLMTESLTLALAGGALGLLTAAWSVHLLLALVFAGADYVPFAASPDARVLAFAFGLSCVAALAFGLLPALRGSAPAGTRHTRSAAWGDALIVAQVALSLVVLAAAGGLARSLANLTTQPFGFERERVLVVDVDPGRAGYTVDKLAPFYRDLSARLAALPGVRGAAFSYYGPFNGCCWSFTIAAHGYPPPRGRRSAMLNRVSPRYFETLGTPLLRGRTIDDHDGTDSPLVAVVNDAFARRFLGGDDPVGKRFSIGDGGAPGAIEIVGLVQNAKYDDPRDDIAPMAFMPLLQGQADDDADSAVTHFIRAIEVRTSGEPTAMAGAVRQAIADIDPNLPVLRMDTLADHVDRALGGEQVVATLAAFFGLVALVLTAIGLYGLTAYSVQRRTREIGVRVALGADRRSVIAMIVREVLRRGAAGAIIGVPAAFVAMRLMRGALYGVSPADPWGSAAAAVLLLGSMLAAGYAPARRASRIEPMEALRHE